ncbi:MAG TPA: CRTAC1 family protein, partial [Vicinamibacteria bacterium]|nr:CRTAC1 family protein [Vicinamibacteria bacterium]
HLLDSAGAGAAFLDYDQDGRLDVFLANGWRLEGSRVVERGRNALYRQRPDGAFEDVTVAAGVGGEGEWGTGVAVADYDNDGRPDILVTSFGRNQLYRNLGGGRFENVAAGVGVESPGWNTAAAFFDADGDGWLDLYVARYIDCTLDDVLQATPSLSWRGLEQVAFGPFGLKGAPDRFFRNTSGRFVDATDEAGMNDLALGFGFAVRAADFDDDGDLDVYVANDSDPNYLYRNDGRGRFKEVAVPASCAFDGNGAAQASMGIAVGDVDGGDVLDLFVTNFSEDFSTLYRGLGGGFFEDVSRETGVGPITYRPLSWGTAFADFDNDGDLDLAVANGHIYPQIDRHPEVIGTYRQRNLLLENRSVRADAARLGPAEALFRDASSEAGPGFQLERAHRGLATGDFDDDGRVDLLVTSLDEPPELLRNEGTAGSWLTVICRAPRWTAIPVGTKVTVAAAGRRLTRDVASGDSYASNHDPRLHFGLGEAERAEEVLVRWPDGARTVLKDVPARRLLVVTKGEP